MNMQYILGINAFNVNTYNLMNVLVQLMISIAFSLHNRKKFFFTFPQYSKYSLKL